MRFTQTPEPGAGPREVELCQHMREVGTLQTNSSSCTGTREEVAGEMLRALNQLAENSRQYQDGYADALRRCVKEVEDDAAFWEREGVLAENNIAHRTYCEGKARELRKILTTFQLWLAEVGK